MKWLLTKKFWKEPSRDEKQIYFDGFFLGFGIGGLSGLLLTLFNIWLGRL
jgi:membrane glycosyltransferase